LDLGDRLPLLPALLNGLVGERSAGRVILPDAVGDLLDVAIGGVRLWSSFCQVTTVACGVPTRPALDPPIGGCGHGVALTRRLQESYAESRRYSYASAYGAQDSKVTPSHFQTNLES
jgi:hypothetical protein